MNWDSVLYCEDELEGSDSMLKVGDFVVYQKCTCGDSQLTHGKEYKVIEVHFPLFMFLDDCGDRRVRNFNTKCFYKKGNIKND